MGVTFLAFLCILAAASAAKDYRNETIKCVFEKYSSCYKNIEMLGANFSVMYAETMNQLNSVCERAEIARSCISTIPKECNSLSSAVVNNNVTTMIHNLCNDKTQTQKFLNSSVCYNKYLNRRQNCVSKYSKSAKTDAKTLCCSNLDIQKCLKKEMGVCPKNSTDFQNWVIETYRGPHNLLCANYTSLCNSASAHLASAIVILLAAKISFMNALL